MKRFLILLLILLINTFCYSQQNQLSFQIDGYGNIDCNVVINAINTPTNTTTKPLYILLPFKIDNEIQLKIADDLTYTFKTLSKKYTLINVILDSSQTKLLFNVQGINNYLLNSDGRSKIEVDFSYADLPKTIGKMLQEKNQVIYKFDVQWKTPKKLTDEEITFFPPDLVKRDSTDNFITKYSDIEKTATKNTWFIYPNFKSGSDQGIQFYLLLLIGTFTAFTQINFIIERKKKILNIEGIIGICSIIILALLFISLPPSSFNVVKLIAAPIVPSIIVILLGVIFLKITEKKLWKISGIIKNESSEPLAYADVELFKASQDTSKDKPVKKMDQLNNGRFEFILHRNFTIAYKLKISKGNRETIEIDIPANRERSYELKQTITLKEFNTLNPR